MVTVCGGGMFQYNKPCSIHRNAPQTIVAGAWPSLLWYRLVLCSFARSRCTAAADGSIHHPTWASQNTHYYCPPELSLLRPAGSLGRWSD